MLKRLAILCLGLGLIGTMACGEADVEDTPEGLSEGGMNLSVHYDGKSDVVGMRYTIERVECYPGEKGFKEKTIIKEKKLKDLTLPGGIPKFENKPFFEDSKHQFADLFTLLKVGCYDVSVQPLKQLGIHGKIAIDSKDCPNKVTKKDVKVEKGKTTEILLISQCKGVAVGALDVIAALNHPPKLIDFEIYPNKFVQCPDDPKEKVEVKFCVRAKDKDRDPIKFVWKYLGLDEDKVTQLVPEHHSLQVGKIKTECVKFKIPQPKADGQTYKFKVIAFDQFVKKFDIYGDPVLITAEEWYQQSDQYQANTKSRASLKFPVHLSCEKEPKKVKKCPLPKNYWKTHNKYAPQMPERIKWPIGPKTDDPAEDTKLCGKTWYKNLKTEPDSGDAFYVLSHQYIAARINIANGAHVPFSIPGTLLVAHGLLSHCTPITHPLTRFIALGLAEVLRKYNDGHLTGKCEYPPGYEGDNTAE